MNLLDNIQIRKVKIGDEKTLAYIQTESWRKAFADIISKEDMEKYADINKAEEMYRYLLKSGVGNGSILLIDDNPHCIAYWDKTREEDMDGYAELICIHSLEDNWGKGYGSLMMDHVLKEIKEASYENVMLWVFEENTRARRFYEKHGFVKTDKKKMFGDSVEVMYSRKL